MCDPTISPSRVSLYLSVGFKTSLWGMNKSYSLPLPNGLFTSSMHHPWVSRTPSMGTTCQPRTHIHGNPTCLCPWEPRTTSLFSTISNIPLLGFLCPYWVRTMNTSPHLPHTTMGSDTTCREFNQKFLTCEKQNK